MSASNNVEVCNFTKVHNYILYVKFRITRKNTDYMKVRNYTKVCKDTKVPDFDVMAVLYIYIFAKFHVYIVPCLQAFMKL